jgi:hypoxanthine phosphoribosyltransferase
LLVEDIEDTGAALQAIQKKLKELGPRSIKVCTLIDKRERWLIDVPVDYVGFRYPRQRFTNTCFSPETADFKIALADLRHY